MAVLLAGLAFNAALFRLSTNELKEREGAYFDFRVRDAMERISARMATYQQVLRGTVGLFDTHSNVSREQFRVYTERQALADYFPGIQGLGFALAIPPEKLQQHITEIRSEALPAYDVNPPGSRELYSSIIFLEPFSGRNLRAFGFDMYSEAVRRQAMQRSTDSGEMSLSGKVRLKQESGVDEQAGFLVYQAVYHQNRPLTSVEERRAQRYGWVYAPFRMNDFMVGVFGEQGNDLIIDIYDGSQKSTDALMHYDSGVRQDIHPGFDSVQPLSMMGHTWLVRVRASTGLLQRIDHRPPLYIALVGVLLSGILSFLTFVLLSGKFRAEDMARAMTKDLSLERARLNAILEGTRVGTWEWHIPTGRTIFNEQWATIVGYKLSELEPVSISTWITLTHPDDLQKSDLLLKKHFAGETPYYECEARMRHKDGHWVWVLDRGKVSEWSEDGKPLAMYGTHQDITPEKQRLENYLHRANHDSLTDLPNRTLLADRINQALSLAKREQTKGAVMYVDLDGFKSVNDKYGHDAGDVVLQTVARRIQRCIRASDTLARVGGDEFVLLLQDVQDEQEVMKIADFFIAEARKPIALPNGALEQITLSVGIALYPLHGLTFEALCDHADQAMYRVKRGSKNAAYIYKADGGSTKSEKKEGHCAS